MDCYKLTHHPDLDVQYLLWTKNPDGVWIHDSWHRTEKNAIQEANNMGLYTKHSQGENQ